MLKCAIVTLIALTLPFASALAAGCPAPKQALSIPKIENANYHQARTRLIAAGWFPVRTIAPEDEGEIGEFGNTRAFWDRGYLEVESCAGTGRAPCAFRWADKYGNQMSVFTEGDESPEHKSFAMITGSRFLCPDEK